MENPFIESFDGRVPDECFNVYQFASLAEAQSILDSWREDHTQHRPHNSLGHLTPTEFITHRQVRQTVEEALCSG